MGTSCEQEYFTGKVEIEPVSVELSVANFRSEVPVVTVEWGTKSDGEDLEVGDLATEDIDLDLFIVNSDPTAFYGQIAAIGANPEELVFADTDGTPLEKGTYY